MRLLEGLVGPNTPGWGIAYHAILRAGAVVTPMFALLTPDEIERQLANAKAKLLNVDPPALRSRRRLDAVSPVQIAPTGVVRASPSTRVP